MSGEFVHLQVRSCYSLLYGTRTIGELVARAADLGYGAMALTDINNLYGVHDFLEACRERGIRPIVGAEVRKNDERALVLVKNKMGFSALTGLISSVMTGEDRGLAPLLPAASAGNIILTDSPGLLEELAGRVDELYAMVTPFSRKILAHAARLRVPPAAVGEVTLLEKGDYDVHRVLRAIAARDTVDNLRGGDCAPADSLLFSLREARHIFSDCPGALTNTATIAGRCRFARIFDGFIFPVYGGERNSAASLLRSRTLEGAEVRYGELSESVMERVDYELSIIGEKGFASYFLIVADIVKKTSRTCGRGSAAASIVSYCLGITNVDPVRHNLYFERFLNPERLDPPDIDVDFAWDERDAIIGDVMNEFGSDRCAMVSTHIHFREASALRDVARAHGLPDDEITAFERQLFRERQAGTAAHIDSLWQSILDTAFRIRGFPRHLSVHVGGLVMTPEFIRGYVPVERAAKNVPVITWDKDGAEAAGLVKIDLLGNRSLAVIRDALANLKENGVHVDERTWDPVSDGKTRDMLARGDTMGVFYVESPAMRQLQKKTGRGDFEHLVIHSSIIRPAANRFITEYVERLGGKPWKSLHPRLDHILAETYGIMCYQEDVSKVAVALAGFTPAEGDGLRKILTKRNREVKLREYRERFFSGASRNGVDDATCAAIWAMIESFDGYSFCKPHSASYAMVSFQSAWLKAHYPAEFMAAVISNGGGYYTLPGYISEARRLGMTIDPLDVNESGYGFRGKGKRVRAGFVAVAGLRHATVKALVEERGRGGPYRSLGDLDRRVHITPADYEILVASGALDSVAPGLGRAAQLWHILINRGEGAGEAGASLFESPVQELPRVREKPLHERLRQEYRVMGFLCDRHPLFFWQEKMASYRKIPARDIALHIGEIITVAGWPVTRKAILTSSGNPMEFVSFEDETAMYETVFFPEAYRRFSHQLEEDVPWIIRGRVEEDHGAVNINVQEIRKVV